MVSCDLQKSLDGYVGKNSEIDGSGSTPADRLLALTPDQAEYIIAEGTARTVNIQMSRPVLVATVINWQIEDSTISDFNQISGAIPLEVGQDTFSVNISTKHDLVYEGDERFILKVIGDANIFQPPLRIPLLITDSSPVPSVSFALASQNVDEDEASGKAEVIVNLSQPSSVTNKISLVVGGTASGAGVDYFVVSNSTEVEFLPGEIQKTITVNLVDDALPESTETVSFYLDTVTSGHVNIDVANQLHTIYIIDNDSSFSFNILGVSGGADVVVNNFLTSGNIATVSWTDSVTETGYHVSILANDGVTIVCPEVALPADTTTHTFVGCPLAEGTTYRIAADAVIAAVRSDAGNNLIAFTVDSTAPTGFQILGAFGANDKAPDNYLAGDVNPAIAWLDATGESNYLVSIQDDLLTTEICPAVQVPANVTAYTFSNCVLTRGEFYRAVVIARDTANNTTPATNQNFRFLVTDVPSNYIILGVKGGTGDTTADDHMDDGVDPIIEWEVASGAQYYEVTLLNMNNTIKCPMQVILVVR